eukprot:g1558.t1
MSASILAQAAALLGPGERIATEEDRLAREEQQKAQLQGQQPKKIFDVAAIKGKIEEIRYKPAAGSKHVPWIESLAITAAKPLDKTAVHEDVKREEAFLQQCKDLVAEGYRRLRVMKVPATRPGDFLAEMFKTDEQMLKVRARIVDEQKRISTVEERKRNQANAKFGKAVGVKRMEEKAKKKKQTLQELEKWKSSEKSGKDKSLDEVLDDVKSQQKKKGKGKKGSGKGAKGGGKGKGKGSSKGKGGGKAKGGKGKGRGKGRGGKGGGKGVKKR